MELPYHKIHTYHLTSLSKNPLHCLEIILKAFFYDILSSEMHCCPPILILEN